ncbi:pentapeptide repeat-containing protein [Paraburkholderia susongensis]|uniref:Uncharacterized protein YjbI, contains pentapeptide repeats n=1 Tax=Paraburkholderia susongensis TaxID=1515439 RepID=A0A1X7M592_9BURK|nr:pentapeptide repeat-containing protein [Paraburkholderia susongensis]SMG61140.1 Uncharacterized protein YjbI, contains pentapeptide repeats [Paraburkholderia susongensis]
MSTVRETQEIRGQTFSRMDIARIIDTHEFVDCRFIQVNWTGPVRNTRFLNCTFDRVTWKNVNLDKVTMFECVFESVLWDRCKIWQMTANLYRMQDCGLNQSSVSFCDFIDGEILRLHISGSSLLQCTFMSSKLSLMTVINCGLYDISVVDSYQAQCKIVDSKIDRYVTAQSKVNDLHFERCSGNANRWTEVQMKNVDYIECVFPEACWAMTNWQTGFFTDCVLDTAIFCESTLIGIAWRDSPTPNGLFDDSRLHDCVMLGTNLSNASFRRAVLRDVDWRNVQASHANVEGIHLSNVLLKGADFRHANLLGQPENAWSTADTRGAVFHERPEFDDAVWWQRVSPGTKTPT